MEKASKAGKASVLFMVLPSVVLSRCFAPVCFAEAAVGFIAARIRSPGFGTQKRLLDGTHNLLSCLLAI